MVATIILSILIFGAAGFVIYRRFTEGGDCEDCHTSCPAKNATKKSSDF